MGPGSTPTIEQARSIFNDLGYAVSRDGSTSELRAERDWKVVKVTPMATLSEAPSGEDGEYRCFVTPRHLEAELRRDLRRRDPAYEWAIIAVDEDDEYDVVRAPPTLG